VRNALRHVREETISATELLKAQAFCAEMLERLVAEWIWLRAAHKRFQPTVRCASWKVHYPTSESLVCAALRWCRTGSLYCTQRCAARFNDEVGWLRGDWGGTLRRFRAGCFGGFRYTRLRLRRDTIVFPRNICIERANLIWESYRQAQPSATQWYKRHEVVWQGRPYHFVPFHGTSGTGRSAVHLTAALALGLMPSAERLTQACPACTVPQVQVDGQSRG